MRERIGFPMSIACWHDWLALDISQTNMPACPE